MSATVKFITEKITVDIMCGKKTNVHSNDKEETVRVCESANCSEEGSNARQREAKATTKNSCIKSRNIEQLKFISQTPNIARSTNLYINMPKRQACPVKNIRNRSCTTRTNVLYKKSGLSPRRKQNSPARKFGSKSYFSKENTSLKHQNVMRYGSSTGGKKNGKGYSISRSRSLENLFSLVPLETTSFEEFCNINRLNNNSHYIKQFDLINRSSSYSPKENSLYYSEPDATPIYPKLLTSKPFLLKRRTYCSGILSVNDSGEFSFWDEKKGNEELDDTLQQDSDYSDTSSENSDVFEDSKSCDIENDASQDKSTVENTSMLKVKQPLRVKYIDETTMLTKELIIYSSEFLQRICEERGRTLPKREIFESIIKQSIDYKGEKLRIIRDSEEFLSNLKNERKSQPNTKLSRLTRYHSPQKLNKNVTKTPRRVHSAPGWIRWWSNIEDKVGMNKWKMLDIKIHSSLTNEYLYNKNREKQLMDGIYYSDSCTGDEEQNELCTKSRTFLKRVNCEEIISSKFRIYFQYYSKLGGRLKSGAVISRMNSLFWLKRCGVIFDDTTFKIANDCFTAVAKSKIVLNIRDYTQYLISLARTRRIYIMDIIRKLMSISIDSPSIHDELEKTRQLMTPILSQEKKKINKISEFETQ